jgi:hypothetical protein
VAAAFVVVVAIAVGGIAYASIPDSNGVIHGCYVKTIGKLRVIDSGGKGCEKGEKPLNWSQTGTGTIGPTGPTGATGLAGATGATGPTGPTGALSSAYLDAYEAAFKVVQVGSAVPFDTVFSVSVSGITLTGGTDVTVAAGGVYQLTVDLQGTSSLVAQLTVDGVGVGPSLRLGCGGNSQLGDCTFTRLLNLTAMAVVRLVNSDTVESGFVAAGSGITIVRIA